MATTQDVDIGFDAEMVVVQTIEINDPAIDESSTAGSRTYGSTSSSARSKSI